MRGLYHHALHLVADPSRVVVRPFQIVWQSNGNGMPSRAERIIGQVLAMEEPQAERELAEVLADFELRHWQTRKVFMARFEEMAAQLHLHRHNLSDTRKQLIGAYFCHEYSYAAAALMNPSIVLHPDQSGLDRHSQRVLMSMRAVGEGHISSVCFREGILSGGRGFDLTPQPPFATSAVACEASKGIAEGAVKVERHADSTLSGTVLFPITKAQSNGLEDLRITRFVHADGSVEYIGTYTAYNGSRIQSELLRTRDFRTFDLVPMKGSASVNKGMALFPRAIGDRYMMIGRQDGENVFILESDDLESWEGGRLLLEPKFPWELVQIGNCGPPIEIPEGWLLLTHGVGAMRKYSIGAVLLDRDDPSKLLGRTCEPILSPLDDRRDGYVPNVVYTCGAIRQGEDLFIPYGVADSSVSFASAPIKEILALMC